MTAETTRLRQDNALLRSLAYEFHVPLSNQEGGYGEVVVRRWTLTDDLWEITDGANTNRQVWIDDAWQPVADVGLTTSHRYALDQALVVARQVAEYEGATYEAWVRATRPAGDELETP